MSIVTNLSWNSVNADILAKKRRTLLHVSMYQSVVFFLWKFLVIQKKHVFWLSCHISTLAWQEDGGSCWRILLKQVIELHEPLEWKNLRPSATWSIICFRSGFSTTLECALFLWIKWAETPPLQYSFSINSSSSSDHALKYFWNQHVKLKMFGLYGKWLPKQKLSSKNLCEKWILMKGFEKSVLTFVLFIYTKRLLVSQQLPKNTLLDVRLHNNETMKLDHETICTRSRNRIILKLH